MAHALGQCGVPARVFPWLLVLLAGLLYVSPARADVELRVPADWAKQGFLDDSATKRATQWAQTLGGRLLRTEGSANPDDYVETLAVIALGKPMDAAAVQSDDAAQGYLDATLAPLVGDAQAQEVSREALPGEGPVVTIRGYYVVGGTRLQTVLVPDGTDTTLVIVGSLESEYILYAPIFTELLGSIQGGSAPVVPFDVGPFRTTYIIGWLVAFVGAFFGSIALFSDRQGDYKRTGGFAAAIIGGLAILAAIITYIAMGDASAGLEAVGSSAGDLAGEVFGMGVIGALLIFGVSQLLEGDDTQVQSAPAASTIVSAPPADQAPLPGQAPSPNHGPRDALEPKDGAYALEDDPSVSAPSAKTPPGPPPNSRLPPPVSSTTRRVKSAPLKKGAPARLENAREEPTATVKLPSQLPGKGPKS